jgi:hypothetical protein
MKGLEIEFKNRIMILDDCGHNIFTILKLRLKPYLDTQGINLITNGNTFYLDGKKK